mmetsp:Transcript_22123/g.47748  ORF Transcript_22123/g.47748 Transcript_22123/m.47748 type:complete len:247 (+) Transcript_22123:957-1697(+)
MQSPSRPTGYQAHTRRAQQEKSRQRSPCPGEMGTPQRHRVSTLVPSPYTGGSTTITLVRHPHNLQALLAAHGEAIHRRHSVHGRHRRIEIDHARGGRRRSARVGVPNRAKAGQAVNANGLLSTDPIWRGTCHGGQAIEARRPDAPVSIWISHRAHPIGQRVLPRHGGVAGIKAHGHRRRLWHRPRHGEGGHRGRKRGHSRARASWRRRRRWGLAQLCRTIPRRCACDIVVVVLHALGCVVLRPCRR